MICKKKLTALTNISLEFDKTSYKNLTWLRFNNIAKNNNTLLTYN